MLLLLRNDIILESVKITFVNRKENLPVVYLGLIIAF